MHQTIFSVSHLSLPSFSMQILLLSTHETHLCCVSYITYFDTESCVTNIVDTWFSSRLPIATLYISMASWAHVCNFHTDICPLQQSRTLTCPSRISASSCRPAGSFSSHASLYNSASHVSTTLTEHSCPWPAHNTSISYIRAPIVTDYMHLPVSPTCSPLALNSQPALMLLYMQVRPLAHLDSLS